MEDRKNKEAYIRIIAGILFLLMTCCWVFKAESYFAVIAGLTVVCNIWVICLQIKRGREKTTIRLSRGSHIFCREYPKVCVNLQTDVR